MKKTFFEQLQENARNSKIKQKEKIKNYIKTEYLEFVKDMLIKASNEGFCSLIFSVFVPDNLEGSTSLISEIIQSVFIEEFDLPPHRITTENIYQGFEKQDKYSFCITW